MVVITPMPRYLKTRCCEDTDHLTNFRKDDYGPGMKTKLGELRVNVGTFLFTDNIRRAAVINPAPIMEKMEQAKVWGEDPVHPKAELYKKLASMTLCTVQPRKGLGERCEPAGLRLRNETEGPGMEITGELELLPIRVERQGRLPGRERPRLQRGLRQRGPEILK